jgi:hypothetical protein
MNDDTIKVKLPSGASLDGDELVIPAQRGRYLIGELIRALGDQELDENEPTHLAYSDVLGLVPVNIITANQQAVLVTGHVHGRATPPVKVSKADLFPYFAELATPGL